MSSTFAHQTTFKDFAHVGLGSLVFAFYTCIGKPSSAVKNAPYGRLTMIRRLYLQLGTEKAGDDVKTLNIVVLLVQFLQSAGKAGPIARVSCSGVVISRSRRLGARCVRLSKDPSMTLSFPLYLA